MHPPDATTRCTRRQRRRSSRDLSCRDSEGRASHTSHPIDTECLVGRISGISEQEKIDKTKTLKITNPKSNKFELSKKYGNRRECVSALPISISQYPSGGAQAVCVCGIYIIPENTKDLFQPREVFGVPCLSGCPSGISRAKPKRNNIEYIKWPCPRHSGCWRSRGLRHRTVSCWSIAIVLSRCSSSPRPLLC